MRTLAEVLAEAEHYISKYGRWGIVSAKHGIVYGDKTTNGKYKYKSEDHDRLAQELGHKLYDGKYAEFYHHSGYGGEGPESESHLAIRTYGKESAAVAHQHFESLPHARQGHVVHEHLKPDVSDSGSFMLDGPGKRGKRYQIKHHLAVLGGLC